MLARGLSRTLGSWQSVRSVGSWSNFDPENLSAESASCSNLVFGEWTKSEKYMDIPDPVNGKPMVRCPDTQMYEIEPFVQSLRSVPRSGVHNPLKHPERYLMLGDVTAKAAQALRNEDIAHHFARLVQRTSPKSLAQAFGEVIVTRKFLENFSGDQPRFLARAFSVPGDHVGQESNGYRWPYGPVGLVTPFNFPLEIPALQMMGALYMGNKPLVHVDKKVSLVVEEFIRLLHSCGLPLSDVDLIHGNGAVTGEVFAQAHPGSILFTGSKGVAEKLARDHHGRVFLEDAGFDWKILGPDVQDFDYVVWQCDQDAYACSGQKCSAQSLLFMHKNWVDAGLENALAKQAQKRNLEDLTIGPVLTWTTDRMLQHMEKVLKIPGAKLMFGGKALTGHSIPECYGAIEPTAVFVPLEELLKPDHFDVCTTELFGPFQILTSYGDHELPHVLEACERMEQHLTAAVVSNNVRFVNHVLAHTVNGTTYAGMRARTTGAPQNHWFGPAGDPRSAGIGTPEAIRLVWSTHREMIMDWGPVPHDIQLKQS